MIKLASAVYEYRCDECPAFALGEPRAMRETGWCEWSAPVPSPGDARTSVLCPLCARAIQEARARCKQERGIPNANT